MRSHGLILENVDGLEDPTVKFVMRGVPHTLGMQVSLNQDTTQVPTPAEMTGWSGDGAPATGSLREFAIGAVTQHFTKRLNRVPGTDFKLPKEHQLDAMEAFQLSLGRHKDFDLTKITFKPTIIDLNAGEDRFVLGDANLDPATTGTCNFCHSNGGANALTALGVNRNFNTNVEDRPHPARTPAQPFPNDGGFGKTPAGPNGAFGNRMFNTAPVVEAADTAPFFHNNVEGIIDPDTTHHHEGPRRRRSLLQRPGIQQSTTDREHSSSTTWRSIRSSRSCRVSTRSRTSTSPGGSSKKSSRNKATRDESRTRGYRRRSTRQTTGLRS